MPARKMANDIVCPTVWGASAYMGLGWDAAASLYFVVSFSSDSFLFQVFVSVCVSGFVSFYKIKQKPQTQTETTTKRACRLHFQVWDAESSG